MVSEAKLLSPPKSSDPNITNLHLSAPILIARRYPSRCSRGKIASVFRDIYHFSSRLDPIGADANSFLSQRSCLFRPSGPPCLLGGASPRPQAICSPIPHQQQVGKHCQRRQWQDSPGESRSSLPSAISAITPTSALSQLLTTTNPAGYWCRRRWFVPVPIVNTKAASCGLGFFNSNLCTTVKFDTAKLPSILNALQTENNGQKLTLEVAVCIGLGLSMSIELQLTSRSNISVRMSSAALPWMVSSDP